MVDRDAHSREQEAAFIVAAEALAGITAVGRFADRTAPP